MCSATLPLMRSRVAMSVGSFQRTGVPCGGGSSFLSFGFFCPCAADAAIESVKSSVNKRVCALRKHFVEFINFPSLKLLAFESNRFGGVDKVELTVEALPARLGGDAFVLAVGAEHASLHVVAQVRREHHVLQIFLHARVVHGHERLDSSVEVARSEEHTSELQSHVNLVCRLLLEK